MPKPANKLASEPPPLTDELIESGADLSAYMSNPRVVPAGEPQYFEEPCTLSIELDLRTVAKLAKVGMRTNQGAEVVAAQAVVEWLKHSEHVGAPKASLQSQ